MEQQNINSEGYKLAKAVRVKADLKERQNEIISFMYLSNMRLENGKSSSNGSDSKMFLWNVA